MASAVNSTSTCFSSLSTDLDLPCCSICTEPYSETGSRQPYSLSCGHTFCLTDLRELAARSRPAISCPTCRHVTAIQNAVEAVCKPNYALCEVINQQIKKQQQQQQQHPAPHQISLTTTTHRTQFQSHRHRQEEKSSWNHQVECGMCHTDDDLEFDPLPGTIYCYGCKIPICDYHNAMHDNIARSHPTVPIEQVDIKQQHDSQQQSQSQSHKPYTFPQNLSVSPPPYYEDYSCQTCDYDLDSEDDPMPACWYCLTCDHPICHSHAITSHHKAHQRITLQQYLQQQEEEVNEDEDDEVKIYCKRCDFSHYWGGCVEPHLHNQNGHAHQPARRSREQLREEYTEQKQASPATQHQHQQQQPHTVSETSDQANVDVRFLTPYPRGITVTRDGRAAVRHNTLSSHWNTNLLCTIPPLLTNGRHVYCVRIRAPRQIAMVGWAPRQLGAESRDGWQRHGYYVNCHTGRLEAPSVNITDESFYDHMVQANQVIVCSYDIHKHTLAFAFGRSRMLVAYRNVNGPLHPAILFCQSDSQAELLKCAVL